MSGLSRGTPGVYAGEEAALPARTDNAPLLDRRLLTPMGRWLSSASFEVVGAIAKPRAPRQGTKQTSVEPAEGKSVEATG